MHGSPSGPGETSVQEMWSALTESGHRQSPGNGINFINYWESSPHGMSAEQIYWEAAQSGVPGSWSAFQWVSFKAALWLEMWQGKGGPKTWFGATLRPSNCKPVCSALNSSNPFSLCYSGKINHSWQVKRKKSFPHNIPGVNLQYKPSKGY